jgi:hypothetical protein
MVYVAGSVFPDDARRCREVAASGNLLGARGCAERGGLELGVAQSVS